MLDLQQLLTQYGIKAQGAIHVGAHEGVEASTYQEMGVEDVLFIEANPTVFERLQVNLASFPKMQAVNCVISNTNGSTTLHITSMDQSSSILPLKLHREIYPSIQETAQIVVECKTLDSLLQELDLYPGGFNLLNIDIQGAELLALEGATNLLHYIDAINTEVNYDELYAGCALINQVDQFLEQQGFKRVATITPYHPSWGDALYIRQPKISISTLGTNGRFGNQFFQYAFLKTYAKEHDLIVETSEWIGQFLFGCQDAPISQRRPVVLEETNQLDKALIPQAATPYKNVDLWGYFQFHSRYYAPQKEYLQSLFQPVPEIAALMQTALTQLRAARKTLVGLHLRRGDYGSSNFPIAPNAWYKKWLRGFWEKLDQPVLFIASDEPQKVVADFADYNPITIADLDIELPEAEFYPDFYLLSQCDAVAISNSSFSFAACLLNEQAKFFFRPDFSTEKLIPFDPWNSELWTENIDNNSVVISTLADVRKQLTKLWLEKVTDQQLEDAYQGQIGYWQWVIQHSFLKDSLPSETDQNLIDQLKTNLATDLSVTKVVQCLMILLLYCPVEDLSFVNLEALPVWLKSDYERYLVWSTDQGQLSRQILQVDLHLREINLILFPDWSQPEELLAQELFTVLQAISQRPHRSNVTLLIDVNSGDINAIDLLISDLAMTILLAEETDTKPGEPSNEMLEITFISDLTFTQWRNLIPLLRGKIALPHEAPPSNSLLKTLPSLTLELSLFEESCQT